MSVPAAAQSPAAPASAASVASVASVALSPESSKAKRGHDPSAMCSASEVYVPPTGDAGFVMGKGLKEGAHDVVLTRGFCMDANEVTVRELSGCVDAKACEAPWSGDPFSMYPRFPDHPANLVTWTNARAFCAWEGKRLPTEAEWEWSATGPEQAKYPWGDEPGPSCETCDYTHWGAPKWNAGGDVGCHGGGPSAVGTHPKGDRVWPNGNIHDLAGNVWEWVEDWYAPYSSDRKIDPFVRDEGTGNASHVLRGGGWNRSYAAMEVTYRASSAETYAVPAIGFRCARTAL